MTPRDLIEIAYCDMCGEKKRGTYDEDGEFFCWECWEKIEEEQDEK